jgi:ring-1,2-phenylacetyl-CoA epoxidase subunit PaaE
VDEYFLCVPGSEVDELSDGLRELGVPPARIHIERYLTGKTGDTGAAATTKAAAVATAPIAGTAEITVRMDGRRRSFIMPLSGEDSILDAAGAAGFELPYSCRAGVCSTCRTKVVRGKVAMVQNYALEDWEVEAGFVLCCQSRPLTPEIEITYDET